MLVPMLGQRYAAISGRGHGGGNGRISGRCRVVGRLGGGEAAGCCEALGGDMRLPRSYPLRCWGKVVAARLR